MTKDEFIAGYCERSNAPWDFLSVYLEAVPCDCGDESCKGWAMRHLGGWAMYDLPTESDGVK